MNCDLVHGTLQAQKIFGNRWTEIAKVVSGRYTNCFLSFSSFLSCWAFVIKSD